MNLKSIAITFILAGCLVLLISGAWNFMKNRAAMQREKTRLEELAAIGVDDNGNKNQIRNKMIISGLMAFTGCLGLFIFISKTTRNKQINQ